MIKNLYIFCEGQTEETFINNILAPYFLNLEIYVKPIICTTKRTPSQKFKGGVSSYTKLKKELEILSKSHSNEYITTMFDYYAMPNDTPRISCNEADIYQRMNIIEEAVNQDIGETNCRFHLMPHEFEGILFSNPSAFSSVTNDENVKEIESIRNFFDTPEHINNSSETAPSKRLEQLIPEYPKVRNGDIVSKEIGIDKIMEECKHFANWINMLKDWVK